MSTPAIRIVNDDQEDLSLVRASDGSALPAYHGRNSDGTARLATRQIDRQIIITIRGPIEDGTYMRKVQFMVNGGEATGVTAWEETPELAARRALDCIGANYAGAPDAQFFLAKP